MGAGGSEALGELFCTQRQSDRWSFPGLRRVVSASGAMARQPRFPGAALVSGTALEAVRALGELLHAAPERSMEFSRSAEGRLGLGCHGAAAQVPWRCASQRHGAGGSEGPRGAFP